MKRNWVGKLAGGVAVIAVASGTALAQDEVAQDAPAQAEAEPSAPARDAGNFDEAFPQMVSDPMVQGDIAPATLSRLIEAERRDGPSAACTPRAT